MTLRSAAWTVGTDEVALLHRAALRIGPEDAGRPIVAIADTASDLNPCNTGFTALAEAVAEGIRDAGGVPVRAPVMSLGEDLMKPSAMLYRNLVAMELEELVRANPIDGVVYLANCDKSVPAALMAAASTNVPSLLFLGGARPAPVFRGRALGSGTDLWRALDDRRAGRLDDAGWRDLERCLACTGPGACNTMGTASTMSILTETLGMALPGGSGLEAGTGELSRLARAAGAEAVRRVGEDQRPDGFLTQTAFDDAAVVLAAIGGSTNAVVHLAAVAGRLGIDASLRRLDGLWREVPLLVDVEPCGGGLVQDFHAAGGVPTLLGALGGAVDLDRLAGDGRTWAETVARAPAPSGVIRESPDPVLPAPTMAAVFGTLAPEGCVIKVAAASAELLEHEGPALVFDSYDHMRTRLDAEDLDAGAETVLVVRGCGPVGAPGMPEWGMAPIPKRLVAAGVRDMVRISDGRMSGTSFGTVLLHVSPESAIGGALALVADGDPVRLSLTERRLDLLVPQAELERRREAWRAPARPHRRGWPRLYQDHVMQAHEGADLDFLVAADPADRAFVEPVVGRS